MIDFFINYESYINAISMFIFVIGLAGVDDNPFTFNAAMLILSFSALCFSVFINIIEKGF